MSLTDWIVLASTLFVIVGYGIWKSRGNKTSSSYLLGDQSLPWYHVGFSVMATQASAITFLSAPGQAYSDGMRFVQFYLGLPLAMIVLCITFVPIFHRLKVFTAYEYLEQRFDAKTRVFTALLFLVQRGLSTGITIYAPSIVLSVILNINTTYTTLFIGCVVTAYTVFGGTKAVSYTQLLQMSVIFAGLFLSGFVVVSLLPESSGFVQSLKVAGKMGKMNVTDWHFDWNNRYTVWSGLIGGFFLQLSYFGTDQSQVGRYLTGKSVAQSRMGLLMNALLKIPLQFLILLIGILVFSFYQYKKPPLFFNPYEVKRVEQSRFAGEYKKAENMHDAVFTTKKQAVEKLDAALAGGDEEKIASAQKELLVADKKQKANRDEAVALIQKANADADKNDTNYIFLNFVTHYLPRGLIGLLIAIIFLASMGSTASALNSLASTSMIDIGKRLFFRSVSADREVYYSRWLTVFWGVFCMGMAFFAGKMGNLLEAVNELGSYLYGTILGVFIVAFYLKKIGGNAVFLAAVMAEILTCVLGFSGLVAYLWLNVIGCMAVVILALLISRFLPETPKPEPA
ncbi:MAG: sodium:solute symporter [Mucilaginibacter polytrichastri]|nr:sodium:solute symporter [Mucilaginibacter polytrichastri]